MREDKQFFNGLIVGAVLMSFVVASAVLYAIRPNSAQQDLPLPRAWAGLPVKKQAKPQPAFAFIDPGIGQSVNLEGKTRTVLAGLQHRAHDLIVRVTGTTAIDGECMDSADQLDVSTWGKNGQQLLSVYELSAAFALDSCLRLVGWHPKQNALVFSERFTEGSSGFHRVWLFDFQQSRLLMTVAYEIIPHTEYEVFHSWSDGVYNLLQAQNLDSGEVSDLYRVEGELDSQYDLTSLPVAYKTVFLLKSDLLADANLLQLGEGILMNSQDETQLIPWKSN